MEWKYWLAAGLICAIGEVALPAFKLALAAAACFVATLLSLAFPLPVQILGFAGTLVLALLFVRPLILRRLHTPDHHLPSRSQAHVGSEGEVTVAIGAEPGRVLVGGEDWLATADTPIPLGARVNVTAYDGIALHVKEF